MDSLGDSICRFQSSFLSPIHGRSVSAGEVNAPTRPDHFRPKSRKLIQPIWNAFAHGGPRVFRPIVHDGLLDLRVFARVELGEGCESRGSRNAGLTATNENASLRFDFFGQGPHLIQMRIRRERVRTAAVSFPKARTTLENKSRSRVIGHFTNDDRFCFWPSLSDWKLPKQHKQKTTHQKNRTYAFLLAKFEIVNTY